ncbi:Uu.00g059090.m01.CDS01 [Anthostomella pinea]|uniref:Uu.00g059090.m01.CDS01 n=1 Tax=Anthostomella pinea TaxID=933095 RepID=A0AAI8YMC8_9PEZI|nr:Uu.00g059090.m01.CDS01 [Anthostomella pinea]
MPGSSIRDTSPASVSSSPQGKGRSKRKQKLTGGDGPGPKKKDKNAKDSGGVVAAVTRHGAKFSNGSTAKDAAPPPESPPPQSPELKPASPASIPTNGRSAPSPLLDAASTTSVSASTAPSANDWAKAMGPLAGSPSNLISIMGDSPPTQPSSYEDPRAMQYAWSAQQQQRHYVNNNAYSASPPNGSRRPLSFQMDHYPVSDIRSQASSPPGIRRSSMHSPFALPRGGPQPPLPHQAQPHFFGAPEVDFDLHPKTGLKAGERGFFFGFDTLPRLNGAHMPGGDNVALAGYEGGLDIYSVGKRGVEPIASLKGLRGGVYNAKILPWNGISDPYGNFPLVAVVVHGPVPPPIAPEIAIESHFDNASSPRLEGISPPQSESNQRQVNIGKAVPIIEAYQTSVEVYSLATNRLIDVLLQAPKTPIKASVSNPIFQSPPPSGAFQVRADDGSVVVSSGTTGECWVYRQASYEQEPGYQFRCVGKLWTSLQQGLRGDPTSEEEGSQNPIPPRKRPQMPIFSVNGRWLAYCPPAPSSQIALNASIPVPLEGKAPGLATLTSPVLPNESSDVDQPISDGVMNRIMRETTQEFIQGARWVGKQGMQLWSNYWKPGQQPSTRQPPAGSPPWGPSYPGRSDASQFPPTYGISGQAVTKEPGLVSIIDLQSLANSAAIHHVTTFKAPLGCSFLSFPPTGLSLFTASSKGDVQTVWDLMRIQYTKSSPLQSSLPNNGHTTRVRQVAQFSRMTVARIVDVAWAKPNGGRAAMVTERGTVHLLDMPPSAYSWPPPRRRSNAPEGAVGGSESTPTSAVSMASNALSSAYGATRPLINRQHRSNSNSQAAPSTIKDHASYGGKVLAAGISHSLGNAGSAINQLRHTGENRVSLPVRNMSPAPSCAIWITGKKNDSLFVVGDGLVRTFPAKTRKPVPGKDKSRFPRGSRYKDFKLKNLPGDLIAPAINHIIDPIDDLDITNQDNDGGNTLVLHSRPRSAESEHSPEASIPQAEIESSAPYQPFHTDRRVGLYVHGAEPGGTSPSTVARHLESASLDDTPKRSKRHQPKTAAKQAWAFGHVISAVKLDVGLPSLIDEDISNSIDDHRALPVSAMERVLQVGDNDEQIVVTTRRRRGGTRPSEAEEDGFFEDDCEVLDFADQRV